MTLTEILLYFLLGFSVLFVLMILILLIYHKSNQDETYIPGSNSSSNRMNSNNRIIQNNFNNRISQHNVNNRSYNKSFPQPQDNSGYNSSKTYPQNFTHNSYYRNIINEKYAVYYNRDSE